MEPVVVIGGSGFIGRHLIRRLAAEGHQVYATHTPRPSPPSEPGVTWVPCNLADPDASVDWPNHCQAVYFLAQCPYWRRFPDLAEEVLTVNTTGLVRAALLAHRLGAHRFIYASTGSVYSGTAPASEADALTPATQRSFYAATKLAGEILLGSFQNFFTVINLRIFMPYGTGQSPDMLLPSLVEKVQRGESIRLHGSEGLQANPVAVRDVVEVMVRCLEHPGSTTWNVAGPEVLTLRKIGETIGRVVNRPVHFETQPGEPPVIVGETATLQRELGWVPATTFERGLREWLRPARKKCA